jgi:PKD repeat protein
LDLFNIIMSRFKQKKYLPLFIPLILLIAVLAVKQNWSIAGGYSQILTNTAQITGYTDGGGGDHTLDPPVTASAEVIVTSTSAQELLCSTPPVLTVEAGTEEFTSCGGIIALGVTVSNGIEPYTYQWSCDQPGYCNISNSTISNPTASPVFRETIYTVVVTDARGCMASDSVLVTVIDAPIAVVTASPTIVCRDYPVTFYASQSSGASLSYNWDFGDGNSIAGPATVQYTYTIIGIFNASLTIKDLNGCKDIDFVTIYVADPGDLVGRISFDFGPTSIFADGFSITSVTSNPITDCLGDPLENILITVMTDRGTIPNGKSIDKDSAPGIQLLTDVNGQISFTLRSGTIGGTATVMARSVDGYAEGASQIEFFDSTSLPIVTGFYPSGYLGGTITPVSEIYVQFNKDMEDDIINLGAVCNNFSVWDITNTLQVNGTCTYDQVNRMAIFTPVGGPLNMSFVYEVTITANAVDIYGNPLDGNYNGFAEFSPTDDFTWTFGNITTDQDYPTVTCMGHTPDPLSPDGDGFNDFTTISARIQDIGMSPSGIRMWQVLIFQDGTDNIIRTLIKAESITDPDSVIWNGKDENGLVVDNGVYNYMVKAIDNDGNWFVAECNDPILVESALDPAYFRGRSGIEVGL